MALAVAGVVEMAVVAAEVAGEVALLAVAAVVGKLLRRRRPIAGWRLRRKGCWGSRWRWNLAKDQHLRPLLAPLLAS
jgi:hypothetical protein